METIVTPTGVHSSASSSSLSTFSPRKNPRRRPISLLPVVASRKKEGESDLHPESTGTNNVPFFRKEVSLSPLSKDAAMGLVLSAATGRGWTTGSGMEGPSVLDSGSDHLDPNQVSTFPWSLFTKSPRRRMRVAFTCNVCGQRTTRAINPHAYTDGTVFVQCCGCNIFHKLVDNLNLFHDMKCYVLQNFRYKGDVHFNYWAEDSDGEDDDDILPSI